MIDKILKAFNPSKEVIPNGNKFTPKIKSTVYPDKVLTFDQIHDRIHKHFQIKID